MKNKFVFFKIIILVSILLLSAYGKGEVVIKDEMKEYDEIFDKIAETRTGIDNMSIDRLKNPFIVLYKKVSIKDKNGTKKIKPTYRLDAIFNNKVKINGKWKKLYSKIGDFKIIKIKKNSILLRDSMITKEIFIRNKNESKIKFSLK